MQENHRGRQGYRGGGGSTSPMVFGCGMAEKIWPANAIAGRINRLLEPLPTEQQLQDLGSFLAEVVQASNLEESADEPDELIDDPELEEVRERTKLFDDPVPEIIFAGRTFCLTGIFLLWMAC